ncbi:probable protein arginine N-methyltransferase 3 isoform X2 [Gastrolobium bilobum]|uniref:probable protein arginine N-methyltransferase 3 isoform X2 n=1 Tax=Gastrolobium bilobum TaxID=150636 RepID=UPI002AB27C8C|nr:probable protein arginine N-methyltransferase 3 isoform X2 [Gastrolobium bilobum]
MLSNTPLMAFNAKQKDEEEEEKPYRVEEEEDDDKEEDWDDWEGDEGDLQSEFLCLFCDSNYGSCGSLFEHCASVHHFDFHAFRKALNLDFYSSFKLINYIRSQVAESRCWSCGLTCQSNNDLQNHLHDVIDFNDVKTLWDDDRYLKPFILDDSLLYSFGEYEEDEDEQIALIDEDEQIALIDEDLIRDLKDTEETFFVDQNAETASVSDDHMKWASSSDKELISGKDSRGCVSSIKDPEEGRLMANSQNHIAKHIKVVNENYFGSYSSFGIHREMLSDKVRMDAYGQAILKNPSLLNGAVVMDVGCGTGILSLFAAQAGALRVIAVEASAKMAAVASQVANDNGFLLSKSQSGVNGLQKEVIEVVHGMVEDIDKFVELQPQSVDVLLSEWMGYCLLYESMLGSVLYARDRWLKPGGAILPDTATIFVAGFGKGGTSLPFWENVCDFDMSCVGKELVTDAAQFPIVDVVDYQDLVTSSAVLQTFDLATMKTNEVDFTATATLEPKYSASENEETDLNSKTCCWCYGVVLWFETGFTSRFCQESPTVLSTSPYTPKTHWSQTILTFREPIAMGFGIENRGKPDAIGTDDYPAVKIDLRVSIVRSTEHRSIDISIEAVGVGLDGQRRSWPAQLFSLQ